MAKKGCLGVLAIRMNPYRKLIWTQRNGNSQFNGQAVVSFSVDKIKQDTDTTM